MRRVALLAIALAGCPEVPPPAVGRPVAPVASAAPAPRPEPPPVPAEPKRVELQDKAMGTRVVLAAYTSDKLDEARVRAALTEAYREIVRLEGLMTTWREDSEISILNASAGKSWVKVSPESFEVISKSLWIAERSEGVFDITFASMGKLWRFDEDRVAEVPPAAAIAAARRKIDYRRIALDPPNRAVKLERSDTRIGLGGIAKGFAIDRAAAVLRRAGLDAFYAQAGGDLYVAGLKPDGQPWRVGVRDPRGDDYFAMLPVTDHAFSTAGDYERAFVLEGKRYHHIIDPRTGYPANASRSVTIWARDALTADAIDDAVFILGPEKGLALVESIDDCGAVIVDAKNKVWISKRLEGRVAILHPPSDGV